MYQYFQSSLSIQNTDPAISHILICWHGQASRIYVLVPIGLFIQMPWEGNLSG